MAVELSHFEASELLGVYALDALDSDEREAVESHLAGCDLCRVEVRQHMEVAGLLSTGVFAAPMSIWDRISAEMEGTPPPLDLAPIQALRSVPPVPSPPPVPSDAGGTSDRRGRPPVDELARRRGAGVRIGALVAAASIAAAVIGVLGLRVVEDGRRIDSIAIGAHGQELERTINAAIADPEVVKVEMRSPDGQLFADAWMLPDGRAYLARNNLPTLSADRNYQLWAVVGDNTISVGLLGSVPEPSAFVANGAVAALAITAEQAGGVVASVQEPLVLGQVRQA